MTESAHDTTPNAELSPREAAARDAMLAKILAGLVAGHEADKRAAANALYVNAGETDVPTLEGHRLGTVKLKSSAAYWGTDPEAWLDYVRAFHPDQVVETVTESVAPAFTAAIIAEHKAHKTRLRMDTGEELRLDSDDAHRLPGITCKKAPRGTLEVKPDPEAAELVLAWLAPEVAALFGLQPAELDQ